MDILEMPMVFSGSTSLDLSIARTTELMQLASFSAPSHILSGDMYGEHPSQQQQQPVQQQQLQQHQIQLQYDMAQVKLGTPPVSPLLLTTIPTLSQIQHSHVVPDSPSTQPQTFDQRQGQLPRTFEHGSINRLNSGGDTQSSSQPSNNCGSPVYNVVHSSTPLSPPPSQPFTYSTVTNASCSPLIAGLGSDFDLFPLQYSPQQPQPPLQSHTQPPSEHQPSPLSFAPEFSGQGDYHQHSHHSYHQHSLSEGTIHMAVSTSAPHGQEAPQIKQEDSDDSEFGYYYPALLPSPTGHTPSTNAIKVEHQSPKDDRLSRRPKSMIVTSSVATSPLFTTACSSPTNYYSTLFQEPLSPSSSAGSMTSSPLSNSTPKSPFSVARPDRRRASSGSFMPYSPPNYGVDPHPHHHLQQQPNMTYNSHIAQHFQRTTPQYQNQQQGGSHSRPQHLHHLLDPLQVPEITDIHECPVCHRRFTRPFNLRSHIITHTTLRPYPCDECHWKFTRQHDLLRHKRAKHPLSVAHLPPPGAKKQQQQQQKQQQEQQQQ